MTAVAYLFPGQGSQQVGMGKTLAEHPAGRAVFDEADETLGYRLSQLCFAGPAEVLMQTEHTQPAILTCSTAALRVLEHELEIAPSVALGHSLGEFSALVAAGALEFAAALELVRLRGRAMQEAVPVGEGAMAAVMKLEPERVDALCAEIAGDQVLAPANENGGGQIVVAGHSEAVARLRQRVADEGGKAVPLKVSAPFHCALMEPAAAALAEALETATIQRFRCPVISNVDAEPNEDPARVRELLVRQVTHRVRWEASVRRAVALGAGRAYELGHGKVMAGLVRRIAPALEVHPVGSPGDVDVLKGAHVDG